MKGQDNLDQNPFVGDVQLRAFVSFMKNQVKQSNALSFLEFTKRNEDLWVRGYPQPSMLIIEKDKMLQLPKFVYSLKEAHNLATFTCKNWITMNRLETLLCLRRWSEALTPK